MLWKLLNNEQQSMDKNSLVLLNVFKWHLLYIERGRIHTLIFEPFQELIPKKIYKKQIIGNIYQL